MTAQRSQVTDSLDQVGLALAVRAHKGRDPRLERQLDSWVGPEVDDRQMGEMHDVRSAGLGRPRSSAAVFGGARSRLGEDRVTTELVA